MGFVAHVCLDEPWSWQGCRARWIAALPSGPLADTLLKSGFRGTTRHSEDPAIFCGIHFLCINKYREQQRKIQRINRTSIQHSPWEMRHYKYNRNPPRHYPCLPQREVTIPTLDLTLLVHMRQYISALATVWFANFQSLDKHKDDLQDPLLPFSFLVFLLFNHIDACSFISSLLPFDGLLACSNLSLLEGSHQLYCLFFSMHPENGFSRIALLGLARCVFHLTRYCYVALQSGCTCISMNSHYSTA